LPAHWSEPPLSVAESRDHVQPPEQQQRSVPAHAESSDQPAEARLDEAAEQRDESAHRRDDAADLRDLASGARDVASLERDQAAGRRDKVGDERDLAADLRDVAGDRRDEIADQRDRLAEEAELRTRPEISADQLDRLRQTRAEAAADRRGSANDRLLNASDRGVSAGQRAESGLDRSTSWGDREAGDAARGLAGDDRTAALADRNVSAEDRGTAYLDELTGAYRRGPGLAELERELARAVRLHQPLAVVFVDLDHLKVVNDSRGHAAGDQLLTHVVDVLRMKLRSYDAVIRYGGDEFVCLLSNSSAAAAIVRLAEVNRLLHILDEDCSVSVGVSERRTGDSADDLVQRADEALYRQRQLSR
jgi:diguanylate cyclase (GGDEF)-like protein